jgi:DNA polymerase subunit Cdc27
MKKDTLVWTQLPRRDLTIVTRNEFVYESFSEEDESDVPVEKKSAVSAGGVKPAGGGKPKKDGAGQKSLMSFFGKK